MMKMQNNNLQRGMSLIELMIAMTLGILIVAGMATLFTQNKNSYRQDELVVRMQEDARYALNLIVDDVELAGFWGNFFQAPAASSFDPTLAVVQDCGPATANWIYNGAQPVVILDRPTSAASAAANFECITDAEYQANTDILLIKRLEGANIENKNAPFNARENGTAYLRTNGVQALFFVEPPSNPPPVVVSGVQTHWKYAPSMYYVRNFGNVAGDGIPTLCRYAMDYSGASPTMAEECVAQGVENMQFEYGIDTDTDGVANQYLSSPTAAQLAAQLVSVRVHLLLRSLTEDMNYTNTKTYTVGNVNYDPPDDGYYRRVYTTTVLIRNTRNFMLLQ